MALKIRLRQQGRNNRPFYRLVLADIRTKRDGKYIEALGWYNPFAPNEKGYSLDVPRIQYWLDLGAQISDRVKTLVGKIAPEVVKQMTEKKVAKRTKAREQRKKV